MPRFGALIAALSLAGTATLTAAQSANEFVARLSWVPISLAQQSEVGGHGTAHGSLSRSRLAIEGSFEGLPAPATAARLHRGVTTGASGPAIGDLTITHATAGTFEGAIEIDRPLREALLAGHLYVQLYAERGVPPDDAVLRGWLLASGTSRR